MVVRPQPVNDFPGTGNEGEGYTGMNEFAQILAAEYREEKIGIMVCGHGSRDEGAMAEFQLVAAGIQARLPEYPIETGYLEFARPVIREGLATLVERGVRKILAVPGMLFAATHVKNDLPWELNTFMAEHPEVEIRFGRDLGIDPKLLEAARDRIAEAEAKAVERAGLADCARVEPEPRGETAVVELGPVLGSDSDVRLVADGLVDVDGQHPRREEIP